MRRQIRQLESQDDVDRVIVDKALVLLAEARALGMTRDETASADEAVVELRRIAEWQPLEPEKAPTPDAQRLRSREEELRARDRTLRAELAEIGGAARAALGFSESTSSHLKKLEPVDYLGEGHSPTCAFCGGPSQTRETLAPLRAGLRRLRSELKDVQQERPRIQLRVEELETELRSVRKELSQVVREARARWELERTSESAIAAERATMRLVGRASIFVEAWKPVAARGGMSELERLRRELKRLEETLAGGERDEALEDVRARLNHHATTIASRLPFGVFKGAPVDLNVRTLQVSVITSNRRVPMEELGSDENALTLHVALSLALQRVLGERRSPVPGVVIYDQLSRPYFPVQNSKELKVRGRDYESLLKYFSVLFEECETEPALQVIVLEHAYFDDDPAYERATRERWGDSLKLVPEGWPERD